jgi:hypothetical protein
MSHSPRAPRLRSNARAGASARREVARAAAQPPRACGLTSSTTTSRARSDRALPAALRRRLARRARLERVACGRRATRDCARGGAAAAGACCGHRNLAPQARSDRAPSAALRRRLLRPSALARLLQRRARQDCRRAAILSSGLRSLRGARPPGRVCSQATLRRRPVWTARRQPRCAAGSCVECVGLYGLVCTLHGMYGVCRLWLWRVCPARCPATVRGVCSLHGIVCSVCGGRSSHE